ncbi:MAG: hypothetical protein JOY90_20520 [Bradyrhizobium sp.]|uniref:hypothetical protein n=1 Tax=Bradyrhizobium sp. TaxID=376 RepID=UPI001D81D92A|nr:hypothetical protein [Bradyrhizobium sp.]MBV9562801.1 hypothetical protein [Bradyrhizobium sp.]
MLARLSKGMMYRLHPQPGERATADGGETVAGYNRGREEASVFLLGVAAETQYWHQAVRKSQMRPDPLLQRILPALIGVTLA